MSDTDSVSFTDGDKYGIAFATGTFLAFDQFNIIDNAIHISFSGISNLIYYWWFHCLSSFYINKDHRRKLLIKCIERFCVSDIEKDLIRMRIKKPLQWLDPWWKQLAVWLHEEQKKIVDRHFIDNPKHTEEIAESTETKETSSYNSSDKEVTGSLLFEQHTANFMQELCLNQGVVFGTEDNMYCHSFSNFAPGQIHMMTNPQYVYVKIGVQKGKQIRYCVQWKNGEISSSSADDNSKRFPMCSSSAAEIIASLVCPVSLCQSHFKLSNVPIMKNANTANGNREKVQRFYCPEIDNYLSIKRDEAVFVPIWPVDPLNLMILRLYHIKRETVDKSAHRITADKLDSVLSLRKRSREIEMDELSGTSLKMADEEDLIETRLRKQYPYSFDSVEEDEQQEEKKSSCIITEEKKQSYSPTNSISTVISFANVPKNATDLEQYKNNSRTLYLVDVISSSHKIKSSTQKGVIEGVIANEKKIIKGTDEPNNEDVRCRLKQDVEMNKWLEDLIEFVQSRTATITNDEKEKLLPSTDNDNQFTMYLDLIEEIKQNDIRLSNMNPHSFHILLCLGYISTLRTYFNINFNIKNINYWFPNIECKQCFGLFTDFSKSILSIRP